MRIVDFLDRSSALDGSNAKFIDLDNDLSLSYREIYNASWLIAEVLTAGGVKPQEIVATYASNSVAAYCCIFAISRIGAIWLPLNVRNTPETNLKLLAQSSATTLVVDEAIATPASELASHFSGERLIWMNACAVSGLDIKSISGTPVPRDITDRESGYVATEESFLMSLLPTGGTTGDSKLAQWNGLTWETMSSIQAMIMPPVDIPACYLVAAPMTHAAGLGSFTAILQGATILTMESLDPAGVLRTIESRRVTHLFLPPTAIYMLLAHAGVREHDYSSLRYLWYAASPMSVEKLKEAIDTFGHVMLQTYGQVEAPMVCTCLSVEDHLNAWKTGDVARMRSCGKISPLVELNIVDDAGNIQPPGREGEIVVKGNLLMRGYHNNPEATAAIRANGWQYTGDIGILDEEGYLSIVDRKKDMIISGGFNVYPGEIEQLLWAHPLIQDCAVIGTPDEKWGEQVTAVVELKGGAETFNEDQAIEYCKNKLGSIKAPKRILVWEGLPKSPVGKVLKKEIRKIFWDGTDRNI